MIYFENQWSWRHENNQDYQSNNSVSYSERIIFINLIIFKNASIKIVIMLFTKTIITKM